MYPSSSVHAPRSVDSLSHGSKTEVFKYLGVTDLRTIWQATDNADTRDAILTTACAPTGEVMKQLLWYMAHEPDHRTYTSDTGYRYDLPLIRTTRQQQAIARLLIMPPDIWHIDAVRDTGLGNEKAQRLITLSQSPAPLLWETLEYFKCPEGLTRHCSYQFRNYEREKQVSLFPPDERALLVLAMVGHAISASGHGLTVPPRKSEPLDSTLVRNALWLLDSDHPLNAQSAVSLLNGLRALGCDMNPDGMSPLFLAIQSGLGTECISALIASGFDVNEQIPENTLLRPDQNTSGAHHYSVASTGATPLHFAFLHRNDDVIRTLMSLGADLTATDSRRLSPAAYLPVDAVGRYPNEILSVVIPLLQWTSPHPDGSDWDCAGEFDMTLWPRSAHRVQVNWRDIRFLLHAFFDHASHLATCFHDANQLDLMTKFLKVLDLPQLRIPEALFSTNDAAGPALGDLLRAQLAQQENPLPAQETPEVDAARKRFVAQLSELKARADAP